MNFLKRGSKHYARTLIKKSATLGANCTIVCGVTIGECYCRWICCNKRHPDFSMWIGTPARFSYWIDKHANKINFDDRGVSKCKKFELVNNKVIELKR